MRLKNFIKQFSFSVGLRINFFLIVIIIFFIILTLSNQFSFDIFSNSYNNQIEYSYNIQELKVEFSTSAKSLSNYLKTGNRLHLSEYNQSISKAKQILTKLSETAQNDEIYFLLQSIKKTHDIYFSEGCLASFFYNTNNYDYYGRLYYSETIQTYLQSYADELLTLFLTTAAEKSSSITKSRQIIKIYTMLFFILIIIIAVSFRFYVSSALTTPLNLLVKQAQAVSEGNFNVNVPIKNPKNSVGVLTKTFNKMVNDVKQNVEYQKLLSQATFLALQAQTNPHFLFNTLNSISRTISLNKKENALQMIESLSKLLRYSLSSSETPVILQDEIDITTEYLKIQKLRFGDRINYQIKAIDELRYVLQIPKFTLQPLVENAIIHGLEPKENGGKILISIVKRNDYAILRIFDNGQGIPKDKINELLNISNSKSKGIGVANTKNRIEIFENESMYGKKVFEIFSRKTKNESWTMIQIHIKIFKEDNNV